ncbi:VOC family protein [Sinomicrobium kalidii]|uniref:VOC family protein n=1 Tax=Sinomicrobium kalidii TaxID=2900738 RepID=UPI001E42306C|nr:VOC family protein [Sinomicrobium kalidii]UGU14944.1 VOC family protein [Sinomicrobium kalidii]
MKLMPYLRFQDNCEEALQWYQSVFGGETSFRRFTEAPMDVPESHKNKIMHAELTFNDNTILACDSFPGQPVAHNTNSISLTVEIPDGKQAERIFGQLAEGGKVDMPFEKQFWNAYFGQLTDKFGKQWMINAPAEY